MIYSEPDDSPRSAPTLETARLRLRPYGVTDLDDASRKWANAHVVRYIGNVTRSRTEVWSAIQRHAGSWAFLGYGYWAVVSRKRPRGINLRRSESELQQDR